MTLPEMPAKMKRRKLILSLLAAVAPVLCSYLSDEVSLHDAMKLSVTAIIGYCVSQGWVDASVTTSGDDGAEDE